MSPLSNSVILYTILILVQISIGLPERTSKKIQLLKEPAFYVNANEVLI